MSRSPSTDYPRDRELRERDLVLPPGQSACVLDETKGIVSVNVGPYKISLSGTDSPVVFNPKSQRFDKVGMDQAIQAFITAGESDYVVLHNPAHDGKFPEKGNSTPSQLNFGRAVNLAGPQMFALWPQQMATVIPGHQLRSNQYLLCRVTNDVAARENWDKAIVKLQTVDPTSSTKDGDQTKVEAPVKRTLIGKDQLTLGKLFIVKGTEVSFYIPPTGVAVVTDEFTGAYVRDAVTLERLEYAILVDEDGNKRYPHGPDVVFPEPTETFATDAAGNMAFTAYQLSPISGLYVKVIADYEEGGKKYTAGDELFITGTESAIYFPRPEHALIKYGERDVHHAVAIPAGEGRYILDRLAGGVELVAGAKMLLIDPRTRVMVRRILSARQCQLWYPGNSAALEHNHLLSQMTNSGKTDYLSDIDVDAHDAELMEEMGPLRSGLMDYAAAPSAPAPSAPMRKGAAPQFGDKISRKSTYSPPRTVVLDSKFEGAVAIGVWTGYAVQVNNKAGKSRVVVGPTTTLLAYDEDLEVMNLSTGTPKSSDKLFETVYLRVTGNKVSDIVEVETKDMCRVKVKLAFLVNFEGDSSRWFKIDNYVKHLTDHVRSMLKGVVRRLSVEEFYGNAVAVIRDALLGVQGEDKKRPGLVFAENGMKVYDVEILATDIGDDTIKALLNRAQHATVQQGIEVNEARTKLEATRERERIAQETAKLQAATKELGLKLQSDDVAAQLQLALAQFSANLAKLVEQRKVATADNELSDFVHSSELARVKAVKDQELAVSRATQAQYLEKVEAEGKAFIARFDSFKGDLAQAMLALSKDEVMAKMVEASAPLNILGGKSVADVLKQVFTGTPLDAMFSSLAAGTAGGVLASRLRGNGSPASSRT